ncbi:MAG: peptidase M22 [Clostridia bacterium]|nr:peptidase M22 [Clostridia bacterium]
MSLILGIDTSNYTTSAALYDTQTSCIIQSKMLLPVKPGEKGVRQSDAVFHHTVQLPQVISSLKEKAGGFAGLEGIGVSSRPRNAEGSYMPCFHVGLSTGRILSGVMNIPLKECSHQEGHIAAALYSSGRPDLMEGRFIAFHVSGGTTEALLVTGNGRGFECELIASSLDLKAGQAIDRTAVMLGLPFPGGMHLEKLAGECADEIRYRPTMRGCDCSLSGIENKCRRLNDDGVPHPYIAKFCLTAVMNSILGMTGAILEQYGELPLLYAGGVMSNGMMQSEIAARYPSAHFAAPEYSCDNAAGVALLAAAGLFHH